MHKVGFVYDDIFLKHKTPQWHPETKERLVSIITTLKDSDFWGKLIHIKPRKADYDDIALAHTNTYIEKIKNFWVGYLDGDTFMSENSLEAALYAAGAVIEAIEKCKSGEISRAFCAVRPPGHHAEADRAMGFCIFNNVAVGARYAQKIGYKRIFIIDFDVHHGNGTQHIFEEDDTVFYFSTHQYPHYPGTGRESERGIGKGEGFTYNVTMQAGSGDKDYLHVYHDILPGLIKDFKPDIVLVSAGYDIRKEDPLASIRISNEGIRGIVQNILSSTDKPVIFTLEGGYDLKALAESVKITVEEMMNI
ncbi:MAG: histone deacetylase [Thermodesulfovibrionales bacterium]|nr:histone deacetylase [Thermodesulfovibrionales bacterium]